MVQERKVEAVEKLAEHITASPGSVFVEFRGLTVAEANRLRAVCREADVRYTVIKNRLAKRAFGAVGVQPPDGILTGPTAIAFAVEEPTAPARALCDFIKDCEHLRIKGGFLGDRWLDVVDVEKVSKIPSREVLLGRLCGSLCSPLTGLARVLQSLAGQRLVTALRAVADQKSD